MSEENRARSEMIEKLRNLQSKEIEIDGKVKILEEKSSSSYEMKLLHRYNDVKDAAQILIGAIGNIEGVTVRELHEKFKLPMDD